MAKSTNDKIIEAQMRAASQAERDKANRDARLAWGRDKIKAIFEGGTVGPYAQWEMNPQFEDRKKIVGYKPNPAAVAPTPSQPTRVPPPQVMAREVRNPTPSAPPLRKPPPVFKPTYGGFNREDQMAFSAWQQAMRDWNAEQKSLTPFKPTYGGYNREDQQARADHYAPVEKARDEGRTIIPERIPIYETEKVKVGDVLGKNMYGKEETFSGIGDDFYKGYYDSIVDYFTPQLQQQYANAKSQNLFNLARRGLLRSSAAATAAGEMERERGDAQTDIANRARTQQDQLRQDVNRAQTNAIATMEGAEDPSVGIDRALREATAIQSQAPDLSGSLGNIFSAALNSYNNYNDVRRAKQFRDSITPRPPTQSSGRSYA